MPRRRGAVTSRRTAVEDGRWAQGTRKGSTTAASRPTKPIKELPCSISNNEILQPIDMKSGDESVAQQETKEVAAPVVSDLGYLHKKFKKVAATFSAVSVVEQSCDEATVTESSAPPADDLSKREGIDSNSSSSPASSSSKPSLKGGRYVCPYCQHACAKPSVLEKHIRAHTNERPYPCVPCGFAFKTKSNLYKHCKSRTHVLKLEESGGTSGTIDPAEIVSDDTSDDNAVLEDSDEGEPITSGFLQPDPAIVSDNSNNTADVAENLSASSAEKFKTPYKPKFHNLKTSDDVPDVNPDGAATLTEARRNPSPGFLHERISQIISKNQAIVETLDPIWPRRYVRQSSRDKESNASTKGSSSSSSRSETSPSARKVTNRERSCSLSVISNNDPSSCDKPPPLITTQFSPSTELRVLQEAEENQRKRCYSEGPAMTESLLRHSVRNLLNHPPPTKLPRTDTNVINSQNPEGSIIKDILLKSRGLLPSDSSCAKEVADSNRNSSSSFSVSALLNHSSPRVKSNELPPHSFSHSSTVGIASGLSIIPTDDANGERPSKRLKISPPASESSSRDSSDSTSRLVEPKAIQVSTIAYGCREEVLHRSHLKTSLPLFGGEVEIHDGHQRTVLRIDPVGYNNPVDSGTRKTDTFDLCRTTTHVSQTLTPTVPKTNLTNSGGGIVQIQHQPVVSTWPKNIAICSPSSSLENPSVSSSLSDSIKSVIIQPQQTSPSSVPFIPGIPGPYSSSGWCPSATAFTTVRSTATTTTCSMVNMAYCTASSTSGVPLITVYPPVDPSKPTPQVDEDNNVADCQQSSSATADDSSLAAKFLRPNSLSLQPGTFNLKKTNMAGLDPKSGLPNLLCVSGPGVTLISPETPRPRKLIRQLYLNGHAYTYLGLKCSTRVYFCCLSRAQPMYVLQQCYPKLSMYSQWKTREPAGLDASSPVQTMLMYDSRQRTTSSTTAHSAENSRMILTHSSYWTNRDRPTSAHLKLEGIAEREVAAQAASGDTFQVKTTTNDTTPSSQSEGDAAGSDPSKSTSQQQQQSLGAPLQAPKRVRIFAGGFKSTEEYTYVRGRGRGRYVCEECGIRCKKPSMLKKHIRTHTDLRPYTCRQCSFSFKTKGNLTKHMKSKAHHKKCTELGIVPVPTTVDEANIDEDSLARQEKLKKMNLAGGGGEIGGSGSGNEDDSADEDSEEEMDEDEEEDEPEGEEEEEEAEEDVVSAPAVPMIPVRSSSGQFEDAAEERLVVKRGEREEEVARSLLDLGVMAPAGSKPTTYPYASHSSHNPEPSKEEVANANVTGQVLRSDAVLLKEEKPDSAYISASSSSVGLNGVVSSIQLASEKKPRQPIDLSTLRSSPLPSPPASSSLAPVHPQNVLEEISRQGVSPCKEAQGVQPTTSGMLQAYLTEKALKEGLMKRHQVRLITPSGSNKNSVIFLPSSSHGIREIQPPNSRAHLPPNDPNVPKIRPEFMVPGSHPSLSVTPNSSLSSSSSSSSAAATAAAPIPYKLTDDGKTACSICNKVFTKPSQLRLHINIHYFERPFRCDACAVSFRTKGHLQKHKRSVTHFNKVNMNLTFGTPSTENPRPFKCSDCMIAFRIHGHLAKHLRSKMHIMKLECLGKLPFGTYAEMERSGINLNEIDTTDCHNSLESLQLLAHRLYKQDPSKIQQWQQEAQSTAQGNVRERTISESSEEFSDIADDGDEIDEDGEDSDGLPDGAVHAMQNERKNNHLPCQSPPIEAHTDSTPSEDIVDYTTKVVDQQPTYSTSPLPVTQVDSRGTASRSLEPAMMCSDCGEPCATNEAFDIHILEKHSAPAIPRVSSSKPFSQVSPPRPNDFPSKVQEINRSDNIVAEPELSSSRAIEIKSPAINHHWNRGSDLLYSQQTDFLHSVTAPSSHFQMPSIWPPRPAFSDFTSLNSLPGMPPPWHQDPAAMAWIASRHMMLPPNFAGQTLPHNYSMSHASQARDPNGELQPRLYSPTSSSASASVPVADAIFPCEICGKTFSLKDTLRQHMLCHAQLRPFVCEFCDAGFTTQKHLESHLILHKPRTS